MSEEMKALLPCPFCGTEAIIIARKRTKDKLPFSIACTSDIETECFLFSCKGEWDDILSWYSKREDAINAWNSRPTPVKEVSIGENEAKQFVSDWLSGIGESTLTPDEADDLSKEISLKLKLPVVDNGMVVVEPTVKLTDKWIDKNICSIKDYNITPSCLCEVPEVNHSDERKINGSKCVKCGGIIRFGDPKWQELHRPERFGVPAGREVDVKKIEMVIKEVLLSSCTCTNGRGIICIGCFYRKDLAQAIKKALEEI